MKNEKGLCLGAAPFLFTSLSLRPQKPRQEHRQRRHRQQ